MVSIVKLASLMFIGIIFFQTFFDKNEIYIDFIYTQYTSIAVFILGLILLLIYIIWSFSLNKFLYNKNYKYIVFIENLIFMIIFFRIIIYSGGNESEYKFIFLFIISSTTIQFGLKNGIMVAIISSVLILIMDIAYMPNTLVNKYFEIDLVLAGIFVLMAWILGFYVKVEGEHIEKLEYVVNKYGLTEVFNHRYFYDALKESIFFEKKGKY